MYIQCYRPKLEVFKIYKTAEESPKLTDLFPVVDNQNDPYILCFDQSTKKTGLTIGTSNRILGHLMLLKDNPSDKGSKYIAEFQQWLFGLLEGANVRTLVHEDIQNQGYYKSYRSLSALRGTFETVKRLGGHTYSIENVKAVVWKSTIMEGYTGSHSFDKENTIQFVSEVLNYPIDYNLEDVYESLGIYMFWYKCLRHAGDKTIPYRVHGNMNKSSASYQIRIGLSKDYIEPTDFSLSPNNRKLREFTYNPKYTIIQTILYLIGSANYIWYGEIPKDTPTITPYLDSLGHYPLDDEKIWLTVVRSSKGKFQNEI